MAMVLKRKHNLVALKVTLETRRDTARVRFELEVTEDHDPRTIWEETVAADMIGLTSRPGSEPSNAGVDNFQLPLKVTEPIKQALRNIPYDGPVWLHLVKPYGALGVIPWERLLAAVGNPILRLPDALADAPAEVRRTLDIILCTSRPAAKEAFDAPYYVGQMAKQIVGAVDGRRVRIHVFADLDCTRELKPVVDAAGLSDHVFIVDPETARDYSAPKSPSESSPSESSPSEPSPSQSSRPQPFASPWLGWMHDSMRGRSVDVVHFLCHGYLADNSGALAFAEAPVPNQSLEWRRFVGAGELGRFLLRVGAWSVAFSSPDRNYSERGLRALADEFAQVRPGPVLHHDCHDDPKFQQLAGAYHFLYGAERSEPRPTPAIALCCQPSLVTGEETEAETTLSKSARAIRDTGMEELPAWIATAHRFIEQKEFEVRKIKKTGERLGVRSQHKAEGIERGVDEIAETLERLVKKGVLP